MWRIGRTETFVRTARRFLRRRRSLQERLGRVLVLLEQDPFDPRLHTHPLHGSLQGLFAVRVTYGVRLIVQIDSQQREVVLIDLGEHDEVYR